MKPFTVVIPLIPQHDRLLKRIFQDLAMESNLIHEVIIGRSETFLPKAILEVKFNRWAKKHNLEARIRVNSIMRKAADGTNRARAWQLASTTYVAFMDADDRYAINRLSIILKIFTEANCDGVIHDYVRDNSDFDQSNSQESTAFAAKLRAPISQQEEFGTITDSHGNSLSLHYAHLSVRNTLRKEINYSDRFPGADVEFCQKILASGKTLYYSPQKLSRWSRNRSFSYRLRLLRKRLLAR
jgi:glycosyltransferase involved in cell wall biosynthesis